VVSRLFLLVRSNYDLKKIVNYRINWSAYILDVEWVLPFIILIRMVRIWLIVEIVRTS
jgi:hypothetical protein